MISRENKNVATKINLEACRAPIDELYRSLRFHGRDRGVDVLGHNVAPVQQAAGHVLAPSRIALDHLHGRLEAGRGELHHG